MADTKDYPAYRWHPDTGEAFRVETVEGDDPTWLSHHPDDPNFSTADATDAEPMSSERVKELLDAGGVVYGSRAKLPTLHKLLRQAFTDRLTAAGIGFADTADLETLYMLLTA